MLDHDTCFNANISSLALKISFAEYLVISSFFALCSFMCLLQSKKVLDFLTYKIISKKDNLEISCSAEL